MPLPSIPLSTIVRKSSKEIVYEHLKQWIIDGTLAPGEKINDSEIATLFAISRTPVREAILNLENQQLVDIIPGKGTTVSYLDMDQIKKLYEAISSIQTSVLEIAFPKIDAHTISQLIEINECFLSFSNSGDLTLIRATDYEFHQVFFTLANNSYLTSFNEQLNIHTSRVENIFFRTKKKVEDSYEKHKELIQHISEKNLAKACIALEENWLSMLKLNQDTLNKK